MDLANELQRLEFLDLTGASENDKQLIERLLFSSDRELQLPWVREKRVDEEPAEVVGAGQEPVPEWVNHQYGEQDLATDEGMPQVAAPPRGAVHPAPILYMMPCLPSYAPQPYGFTEVEQPPPRPMMRPTKKNEKKFEPQQQQQQPQQQQQQQPYAPPMGNVYYYSQPVFSAPHFFHPLPVYQEPVYQHYVPDQAQYPDEATYGPAPPVDPISADVKQENSHINVPVPETHEHLCYEEDVTVKAPKRKQTEPVAVEVVLESPPVPVPLQPAPPVPLPAPVVLPVPVVAPVPVVPHPVRTIIADDVKPRGIEYANGALNEVLDNVEVKSEDVAEPEITPKKSEYPELLPSVPAPVNPTPPAATRSWAGLFGSTDSATMPAPMSSPMSADKPRPLARVPPFDLSESTAPASSGVNHMDYSLADFKAQDDPYTVRLGECLKTYQLDHKAVSYTPRGLTNRSNWCYVNAILQALIACPSFFNLLRSLPVPQDSKQASRTPIIGAMVELVHCFPPIPPGARPKQSKGKHGRDEVTELPTGSSFEPSGVYKVLDRVRGDSGFTVEGRQEDAEEFLSCLLNGLNDEMFEVLKIVGEGETELPNGDSGPDMESGDDWKVMGRKKGAVTRRTQCGKTPVSDIFRGQVRSRVQRAGDEYTDNVQPFFTLQLDIEKANSVKEALELMVGKDPLEGMTCSKTHQEIEAWTQTTLEDLPLTLILHLKCFDYKQDSCSKITKTVSFPVELKIEMKLMSVNKSKYKDGAKLRTYKLVAVVYHDGKDANKGHYVTDAYHVGLGCWIRYDDGNVRRVREEHVLRPVTPRVPYLLYYRRTDTITPTKP